MLLNSKRPDSAQCKALAKQLSEKYQVGVIPINCLEMTEEEITDILTSLLYEFPIRELKLDFPRWIMGLDKQHELRQEIYSSVLTAAKKLRKVKDSLEFKDCLSQCKSIKECRIDDVDLSDGCVKVTFTMSPNLFYEVLSERTGFEISNEQELMQKLIDLSRTEKEFARFSAALHDVETTGYGIVMPEMQELTLDDPEIMKQGGRYGVRLKASAPSIHMLKANITTEVAPIVGTESQSVELIVKSLVYKTVKSFAKYI